jgi:hypothetical protein
MALQHNWEREVLLNSGLKQDHQAIKRIKEPANHFFCALAKFLWDACDFAE